MQPDEPYPHAYDGKAVDKLGAYEDVEEQCIKECGCGLRECALKFQEFLEHMHELAEYWEVEKQGLLPKFHMADEFWVIGYSNRVLKAKIVMLQQKKDKTWKYRFCDEYSNTYDYAESEVGKRFFLTRAEAEQFLMNMKEK